MFNYLASALILLTKRDDERGASAVEYGLLVAGIAAIIVVAVFALGGVIDSAFSGTCTDINAKVADASATC